MNRGGYQILNLKNMALNAPSGTAVVIKGIYEKIEGTRKPILVSGVNIKTGDSTYKETHDFFALPEVVSTSFVLVGIGYSKSVVITVTDDDEVYGEYVGNEVLMPIATTSTLGIVSVGTGLAIDEDGELTVDTE